MKEPKCTICSGKHYKTFCMQNPKKPIVNRVRRIRPTGKEYDRWRKFRDTKAIPYLDKTFGHKCRRCGVTENLDVDHIHGRGSHPQLKYQLSNLQYLCRSCHRLKTDHLL